ncbi:MAG: TasA family protein [Candidatus Moranbacteria bacterium]|nr:TasA family protein [Candidatus Moranbacteria bacterium]
MKNIIKSLVIVVAVAAVASVATWAIFSSTATVDNNSFATGTLQIRVNGQPTIAGFTASDMAPGDCKTGEFDVQNYGAPWFAGPSTLTAKELVISTADFTGDTGLCNALTAKIERCSGTCETAYATGALNGVTEANLLMSWYGGGLIAGSSITTKYEVCLPTIAGDTLQGKTCTFDFVMNAYNPHR